MLCSSKLYLALGLCSALHATSASARVIPRHAVPSSNVILPPVLQPAPISSPNIENNRDLRANHPGLAHCLAANPTTVQLSPTRVLPRGDPRKTFIGAPHAVYNYDGPHGIFNRLRPRLCAARGNSKPVWVMDEAKAKPIARGRDGKWYYEDGMEVTRPITWEGDAGKLGEGGKPGEVGKPGEAGKPGGIGPQPHPMAPPPAAKPDSFSPSKPNPNNDHPVAQQSKPESKPESSNPHTGMMALLSDLADNGFHAPGKHDHKPESKPTEPFG
nr:hypothetical protein B0A51_10440 [Rachicladosporium sp. CCFEE 5018]